jgi:hypothetical protein
MELQGLQLASWHGLSACLTLTLRPDVLFRACQTQQPVNKPDFRLQHQRKASDTSMRPTP